VVAKREKGLPLDAIIDLDGELLEPGYFLPHEMAIDVSNPHSHKFAV
jgi:hypothetical protein